MKLLVAASVCSLLVLSGCSDSGADETVRSGNGPTPANSESDARTDDDSQDSKAAETATSPLLKIEGNVKVPEGEEGALSVVLIGPANQDSGSVPVVIRNMTGSPLTNLEVSGTARSGSGALLGSGSSQGFAPELVNSGEWAFGYVYLEGVKAAKDTKFDFTATGSEPDDFMSSIDVEIAEVARTKSEFGEKFTGILKNPTDGEVSGPVDVSVACFDKSGALRSTQGGFADSDPIAAGGTSSFSVDLYGDKCPSYAMGASGYDF